MHKLYFFLTLSILLISLITHAATIDNLNSDGVNALTLAVRKCDKSEVSSLLNSGANSNVKNKDGSTPLMWVGFFQNPPESVKLEIAKILVEHGGNVNEIDNYGHSVLEHQVPYNLLKVIEYLISKGALDNDSPLPSRSSALLSAIEAQKDSIVKKLLEGNINPNRERIIWASMHYSSEAIRQILINAKNFDKKNPLWVQMAARESRLDILKKLIALNADINAPDEGNRNALMLAIENDKYEAAKLLIEAKANTELKSNSGYGSLNGETAICIGARKNNLEIVNALIASKANINNNCSALNIAVKQGNIKIIEALIKAGADLKDRYSGNWKSLFITAETDQIELAKLLINAGTKIDIRDEFDSTPLMIAASKGSLNMIQLLVENGANINAINSKRSISDHRSNFIGTPLGHAIEYKQIQAEKLLRELGAKF